MFLWFPLLLSSNRLCGGVDRLRQHLSRGAGQTLIGSARLEKHKHTCGHAHMNVSVEGEDGVTLGAELS